MFDFKKIKIKINYWLVLGLTIFLIIIIFWGVTAVVLQELYAAKFFPGIKVAGINLSGMSWQQANDFFKQKEELLNQQGVIFKYENHESTIYPVAASASDPDLSQEIYSLNAEKTLNQAFAFARSENEFFNFFNRIRILIIPKNFKLDIKVSDFEFKRVLRLNFDELLEATKETSFEYLEDNSPFVVAGKHGEMFDYNYYLALFSYKLSKLNFTPIVLQEKEYQPKISPEQAEQLLPQLEQVLLKENFSIRATVTRSWFKQPQLKEWFLTQEDFKKGLIPKWDSSQKKAYLGFSRDYLQEFLSQFKEQIEIQARDAKFEIKNGRVVEFQASQDGVKIDYDKTLYQLEYNLIDKQQDSSWIYTVFEPAEINTSDINDLGVQEIVGIGKSNFRGSPANRIHNIKNGAVAINGLIIAPGEEFSVNGALGEISARTGYLPELVIKGNRTIAEYGGGLCQIGTTMFRLALDAGLEITERKPHAYRVIYYEPAGTDATIYPPHPDFRFINDTDSNLLLQTRVEGYDLIFEFWGKSDGRQVKVFDPTIWNISSPGPTKYIETEDLEPGKLNCIEHAVNGAEANLKREITYATGEVKEENWYSRYRPWQEVCLVGVEKIATSTDEIINNP